MALPVIYADTVGMRDTTISQGYIETTEGSGSLTFGSASADFGDEFRTFGGSGVSPGTFVSTSAITNAGRVNDNLDGAPAGFVGSKHAGIRISLTSAKAADFLALKITSADQNASLYIYTSDAADSGYDELTNVSATSTGWLIHAFTETTKRYWTVQMTTSGSDLDTEISEVILGSKLEFPHMFSMGAGFGQLHQNKVLESYNGVEYAHKTGRSLKKWNLGMPNINSTFKGQLITLYDNLFGSDRNFLFIDNVSDKYFVRMINKPEVGQIASDRYSANLTISE